MPTLICLFKRNTNFGMSIIKYNRELEVFTNNGVSIRQRYVSRHDSNSRES